MAKFLPEAEFAFDSTDDLQLLPLRFERLDANRYLTANLVGDVQAQLAILGERYAIDWGRTPLLLPAPPGLHLARPIRAAQQTGHRVDVERLVPEAVGALMAAVEAMPAQRHTARFHCEIPQVIAPVLLGGTVHTEVSWPGGSVWGSNIRQVMPPGHARRALAAA